MIPHPSRLSREAIYNFDPILEGCYQYSRTFFERANALCPDGFSVEEAMAYSVAWGQLFIHKVFKGAMKRNLQAAALSFNTSCAMLPRDTSFITGLKAECAALFAKPNAPAGDYEVTQRILVCHFCKKSGHAKSSCRALANKKKLSSALHAKVTKVSID